MPDNRSILDQTLDRQKRMFRIAQDPTRRSPHTNGAGSGAILSRIIGTLTWWRSRQSSEPVRDEAGRFVSQHRRKVIETARQMRAAMPEREWSKPL